MQIVPPKKQHPLEHAIPPPLLVLVIGIGMWATTLLDGGPQFRTNVRFILAGVIFIGALAFGAGGILNFVRAKTTVNPVMLHRASTLVTNGAFRMTRNPMYVGLTGLLFGWALVLGNLWSLLGPLLFGFFINRFQIVPEERAMTALFGDQYELYKSHVRRWL